MTERCLFLLSWEPVLVGVRLLVDADGYVELVLRADMGGVGLAGSVTWTTGTLRTLPASGSGGACSCGVVGLGTAGGEG